MTNESKVTILLTRKNCLATKKFVKNEDGSITKVDYNAGKYFKYYEETVSDIYDLSNLLLKLTYKPHNFIILGQIKENMKEVVSRKCKEPGAAFDCVPRKYLMLDIDNLDAPEHLDPDNNPDEVGRWVQAMLPMEFNDVTCHYQLSASQNVPYTDGRAEGKVSLHRNGRRGLVGLKWLSMFCKALLRQLQFQSRIHTINQHLLVLQN